MKKFFALLVLLFAFCEMATAVDSNEVYSGDWMLNPHVVTQEVENTTWVLNPFRIRCDGLTSYGLSIELNADLSRYMTWHAEGMFKLSDVDENIDFGSGVYYAATDFYFHDGVTCNSNERNVLGSSLGLFTGSEARSDLSKDKYLFGYTAKGTLPLDKWGLFGWSGHLRYSRQYDANVDSVRAQSFELGVRKTLLWHSHKGVDVGIAVHQFGTLDENHGLFQFEESNMPYLVTLNPHGYYVLDDNHRFNGDIELDLGFRYFALEGSYEYTGSAASVEVFAAFIANMARKDGHNLNFFQFGFKLNLE